MDIILFFVFLSLLAWIISMPSSIKRKIVAKDLIDAIKGGTGMGIVYAIIVALFIAAVRLVIYLYVKMFFAD